MHLFILSCTRNAQRNLAYTDILGPHTTSTSAATSHFSTRDSTPILNLPDQEGRDICYSPILFFIIRHRMPMMMMMMMMLILQLHRIYPFSDFHQSLIANAIHPSPSCPRTTFSRAATPSPSSLDFQRFSILARLGRYTIFIIHLQKCLHHQSHRRSTSANTI
jgi:hypothetical protein